MKMFDIGPGFERRLIQEKERSEGLVLPPIGEDQRVMFLQRLEDIKTDLIKVSEALCKSR